MSSEHGFVRERTLGLVLVLEVKGGFGHSERELARPCSFMQIRLKVSGPTCTSINLKRSTNTVRNDPVCSNVELPRFVWLIKPSVTDSAPSARHKTEFRGRLREQKVRPVKRLEQSIVVEALVLLRLVGFLGAVQNKAAQLV